MDDNYIVEVWGQPASIVLKEEGVYRFHATASPFFALEGTEYDEPGEARPAAARLTSKDTASSVRERPRRRRGRLPPPSGRRVRAARRSASAASSNGPA